MLVDLFPEKHRVLLLKQPMQGESFTDNLSAIPGVEVKISCKNTAGVLEHHLHISTEGQTKKIPLAAGIKVPPYVD